MSDNNVPTKGKKQKYYVVWQGKQPGIYLTWDECKAQVHQTPGARYKSFETREEAEVAFSNPPATNSRTSQKGKAAFCVEPSPTDDAAMQAFRQEKAAAGKASTGTPTPPPSYRNDTVLLLPPSVKAQAIAVDAASSGNPGPMEYQGVDLSTGQRIFHFGPIQGTNNIGEFLAIVHGLALLQQKGLSTMPIYSDSVNAMSWVRQKKCKTQLAQTAKTAQVWEMIRRAETWLHTHTYHNPLIKWQTKDWGEIPADFGRKQKK